MPKPNATTVTYLKFVLDALGISPTALAKGAKLAATTLTRALNDPDHKYSLSTTTIEKIAAYSGISPAPFFDAKDFVGMATAPYESSQMFAKWWGVADVNGERKSTIYIGKAAAGVFRPKELVPMEMSSPLLVGLPGYKSSDLFCILVDDNSVNLYIPKGFYALCIRAGKLVAAEHGSLVVVERRINDGQLMELSIRRLLVPENGAPYLRLDSTEPDFSERITLPSDYLSSESPRIIGTVIYAVGHVEDRQLALEAYDREPKMSTPGHK